MNHRIVHTVTVIGIVLLLVPGFLLIRWLDPESAGVRTALTYGLFFLPSFVYLSIRFGFSRFAGQSGLARSPLRGFLLALLFASPMLAGTALTGQVRPGLSVSGIVLSAILPGFFEEYLFRGFLFRQLFLQGKLGFLPAVLISALLFGLGHMAQGHSLPATLGVIAVTSLGGAWFAWLMTEWEDNLWVPVFLHMLMNFSWTLFETGTDARGTLAANLFRILTIALGTIITIRMAKKRGSFTVNRKNLFAG